MSKISITPDTMRTRAVEYGQHNENLVSLITQLDQLLVTLESEWEGEATRSFSTQWHDIKPSFNNCSQLLMDISTQLNTTASAMESLDSSISKQMGVNN